MSDKTETPPDGAAILDEMAHWTGVIGKAQQMLMEHGATAALKMGDDAIENIAAIPPLDTDVIAEAPEKLWTESLDLFRTLMPKPQDGPADARLAKPAWQDPLFELFAQGYSVFAEQLIERMDAVEGIDARMKAQLRFAARGIVEATSPANFAFTNPEVVARIVETRGANLLTGIERMLADASSGQLRHVAEGAFEVGRNVATTPGKVLYETPLFQLIHYTPTTERVQATPLVIFPPWINRFYILDLNPKKSFVKWAVDQGISTFIVSWKSADASIAGVTMDDYVLAQLEAIEVVRKLLEVERVHTLGYCVAGTALSMLLAWLAATGHSDKIASATFFTAQVDFSAAGDLLNFIDDGQLKMIEGLTTDGVLDGRYLAAAFNLLRGRDLIWSYVVDHYLLAKDYPAFDLLHWNGDVTNLPAGWHRRYLEDLYRDNLLVKPGALSVAGVPIDLTQIETPAYIQAGREDHIAPPESVWKATEHFAGPLRFVLAGSGHIAGVVNPPSANKYAYWLNDAPAATLEDFIAGATEHPGSWWPDWLAWISERSGGDVPAEGARIPGEGGLHAIEDAPGSYVRTR